VKESVRENHQKYLDRIRIFKDAGCDMEFEREALLEQALPISGSILEIGTGKGHLSIALAKKGYSLISVDISQEEQEYARLNAEYYDCHDKIDFQIADAERLTFSDRSFDVIFSVNALHHFSHSYKVADEMIRVLKRTGKLIMSDFSQEGFDLVLQIHQQEGRQHSRGSVAVNDMGKYLTAKGLIVNKHRTVFQETLIARYSNRRLE
jgi:ubiquinone/menaquinone biosynthesis C-methylase UbiE